MLTRNNMCTTIKRYKLRVKLIINFVLNISYTKFLIGCITNILSTIWNNIRLLENKRFGKHNIIELIETTKGCYGGSTFYWLISSLNVFGSNLKTYSC